MKEREREMDRPILTRLTLGVKDIGYLWNIILYNLKSFCGKKDAFDCAGIRSQVFRLPVDCSNQLSYTGVRHLLLHRKTSFYRPMSLPYGCVLQNSFLKFFMRSLRCHMAVFRQIALGKVIKTFENALHVYLKKMIRQ